MLDFVVQPHGSEDSVSTVTLLDYPEEPRKGKLYNRGLSQGLCSLVLLVPSPCNYTWDILMSSCRRHLVKRLRVGRPCVPSLGLCSKPSLTRSVSKVSSISMICWMLLVTVEMTLSMRCTTPLVAWWSAFSSRAQLTVTICQRRSKVVVNTQESRACLQFVKSQDRTPLMGQSWAHYGQRTVLGNGGCPYPVGIVMDLDVGVLVHGGESHAVLELVCQDPPVHHVVAEGIEQFNVDVAHQGVQHFLERMDMAVKRQLPCAQGRDLARSGPRFPFSPLVSICERLEVLEGTWGSLLLLSLVRGVC